MKYIRVCDEYENEYITTYKQHCEDVANMQDSGFDFEGCILKQADTIEELCDEFVYHFLISKTYEIMPKEDLEPQRRDSLLFHIEEKHFEVFGAIWTDKGLIYVAKMNDKGELELL